MLVKLGLTAYTTDKRNDIKGRPPSGSALWMNFWALMCDACWLVGPTMGCKIEETQVEEKMSIRLEEVAEAQEWTTVKSTPDRKKVWHYCKGCTGTWQRYDDPVPDLLDEEEV